MTSYNTQSPSYPELKQEAHLLKITTKDDEIKELKYKTEVRIMGGEVLIDGWLKEDNIL